MRHTRFLFRLSLVLVLLSATVSLFRTLARTYHPSTPYYRAQLPSTIELPCPAGSQPMPGGTVSDNATTLARQWLCVDYFGNVSIQGLSAAPGVGSGPGGGSGGGGGGGGGTGPGPTGAASNCLSQSVLPSYACMGPSLTSTGANPSFESNFTNVAGSVPGATALSVTGNPIVASSSALFLSANTIGASYTLASGFSSIQNTASFVLATETLSSTSSINPNFSIGSTPAGIAGYLFFIGGNISSTPTQSVSGAGGGCVNPAITSEQCSVITMGAVSAAHFLLTFCKLSGNNNFGAASINDTLGDGFTDLGPIAIQNNTGTVVTSVRAWLTQNPTAGSPVITMHGGENTVIPACQTFELSGQVPYFTGTQGPPNFRRIQTSDLPPIFALSAYTKKNLASTVSLVANTLTTVDSLTITMPAQGCPCRIFVEYHYWTSAGTGVYGESFATDGTNNFVGAYDQTVGASNFGGYDISGLSTVTYFSGQSVTITIKAENSGAQTIASAAGLTSQSSYMSLSVLSSQQ